MKKEQLLQQIKKSANDNIIAKMIKLHNTRATAVEKITTYDLTKIGMSEQRIINIEVALDFN
jgi:hypothetical protein